MSFKNVYWSNIGGSDSEHQWVFQKNFLTIWWLSSFCPKLNASTKSVFWKSIAIFISIVYCVYSWITIRRRRRRRKQKLSRHFRCIIEQITVCRLMDKPSYIFLFLNGSSQRIQRKIFSNHWKLFTTGINDR